MNPGADGLEASSFQTYILGISVGVEVGGGGEGSAWEEQRRHHSSSTCALGQAEMGRKVQGGMETAHRSPRPTCCRFLQGTQGLSVAGFP